MRKKKFLTQVLDAVQPEGVAAVVDPFAFVAEAIAAEEVNEEKEKKVEATVEPKLVEGKKAEEKTAQETPNESEIVSYLKGTITELKLELASSVEAVSTLKHQSTLALAENESLKTSLSTAKSEVDKLAPYVRAYITRLAIAQGMQIVGLDKLDSVELADQCQTLIASFDKVFKAGAQSKIEAKDVIKSDTTTKVKLETAKIKAVKKRISPLELSNA